MLKRLLILMMLLHTGVYAQEVLTLEEAVERALEHNFDIRIARTDAEIAEANNTLGNAGMSPNVNASGGVTTSSQNVRMEFLDGRVQKVNNAASFGYNGSVNLNWTLFDGGKMFLMKKQLNQLELAGKAQLKEQVQQVISQVVQAYAQVVLQQQGVIAIDTALVLAKTRMDLSRVKYETGTSAKVDFLQARVDYNSRRSDSLQQQSTLTASYATLNALMGEDADKMYKVQDELELNLNLDPKDKELLENINPTLNLAKYNADVARLDAKMAKRDFMPTLALNGAYTYNNTRSQSGFVAFNQSSGPNGGLTLSLPLFRGGNIRREAKVASLNALRYDLLLARQSTELGKQYRTAWRNYEMAVAAYRLEQENLKYAKENLDIQQERFKVGIANTLETREAESSYVDALVRFYTTAYNLKVSETKVLELEGGLVD